MSRGLHRNVWATSATSFLTDVSSEMIQHVLPLFLANVLGVRTWAVGVMEGVGEATASILKLYSGRASDRLGTRKWPAVGGYGLSSLAKPLYFLAGTWMGVAMVRWMDRVGKGIRSAPRDALLADSVPAARRGLAFGIHRAADTGGAVVGLLAAIAVVGTGQGDAILLAPGTFRTLVAASVIPAFLAVVVLAAGARDVPPEDRTPDTAPHIGDGTLGRPFFAFVAVSALFQLGNSSDAFLVLLAQARGVPVVTILGMVLAFNIVYTAVSAPAGWLADRFPRKWLIMAGWWVYAAVYGGFAVTESVPGVASLFMGYGAYYGLVAGSAKALIADLVPADLRGTAFGTYHAVIGLVSLPASILAGVLWQGVGPWAGWGAPAPFIFGAATAAVASLLLAFVVPDAGERSPAGGP
ncbi:MAG: MFS transporter [Gemmatimonadota bacterium]|nr:MFS transporter [Gemmatimonadota bacterium]MDH5760665.1 MFS transporter [Gemmatimonadota bacterium]